MKRIKQIIIYTIIFIGFVLFFTPKIYCYYAAEDQLNRYHVKIAQERIDDSGFTLNVYDGKLYYDDLYVGVFDKLSIWPFLLFNRIDIENFNISKEMSRFAKGRIESLTVHHHLFSPLTLQVTAHGEMGEMHAQIDLSEKTVSVLLEPSKALLQLSPFWLRRLKKTEEGGYAYETTFE